MITIRLPRRAEQEAGRRGRIRVVLPGQESKPAFGGQMKQAGAGDRNVQKPAGDHRADTLDRLTLAARIASKQGIAGMTPPTAEEERAARQLNTENAAAMRTRLEAEKPEEVDGLTRAGMIGNMTLDPYGSPLDRGRLGNVVSAGGYGSMSGFLGSIGAVTGKLADAVGTDELSASMWGEQPRNAALEGAFHKAEADAAVQDWLRRSSEKAYADAEQFANDAAESQILAKDGLGFLGGTLVDTGIAGVQMAGDIGLGMLTGTSALAPMGVRSFGGGALEAQQAGADSDEQMMYGLASALVEVGTEKLSNLTGMFRKAFGRGATDSLVETLIGKLGSTANGRAALRLLAGALGEGAEEVISGVVNPLLQGLYNGQSVKENYSELDVAEVAYEGLIGALLGTVGGMVSFPGDVSRERSKMNAERADTSIDGYYETAQEYGAFSAEAGEAARQAREARSEAWQPKNRNGEARLMEAAREAVGEDTADNRAARVPTDETKPAQSMQEAAIHLEEAGETLGENGGRALRAAYDEGQDVASYYAGFAAYYRAGISGLDMEKVDTAYTGALTEAQRAAAYMAGQNDAAESLAQEKQDAQFAETAGQESGLVYDEYVESTLDKDEAEQIDTVAKLLGVRVRFVDRVRGGTANAQISGAEIEVEKGNPNPMLYLLGHEWTHRLQAIAPEQYRAFRDAVAAEVDSETQVLLEAYRNAGEDIRYETALDEAVSNYAGRMLEDGRVLDEFIERHRSDRTLLEKVRDALRELARKLTGAERHMAQTAEGKLNAALDAAAEQVKALEGQKNAAPEGGRNRSDPKYLLNADFGQQLDAWLNERSEAERKNSHFRFLVGTTSDALKSIGIEDYKIYWNAGKVAKIMSDHPEMTADIIRNVPKILEDPIIVMQSQTVPNRVTIFGNVFGADGSPVLTALEFSVQNKVGEIQDYGMIASAYGKSSAQQLINTSDILYLDPDEKRTNQWLLVLGLQLPSSITTYGPIAKVTQVKREVNGNITFGDTNEKTAMQLAFEKAQEDGEARFSLKTVAGKQVVWIEKSTLTKKELNDYKAVANFISQHIGDVYTIIESGQKVYIGADLPVEYTQSKYTSYLHVRDRPGLRAKNKAVDGLGELIETATNRRWEQTQHTHNKDAPYGMYRYDSSFAFPVRRADGTVDNVRAYDVELVIRNGSDGKKYLYDIVNIKENTTVTLDLLNREVRKGSHKAAAQGSVSTTSVAQNGGVVNTNPSLKGSEDAKDVAALRKENETRLTEVELREKLAEQNAKSARAVGKARAELRTAVRRDVGSRLRASGAPDSMAEPLTRLLLDEQITDAQRALLNAEHAAQSILTQYATSEPELVAHARARLTAAEEAGVSRLLELAEAGRERYNAIKETGQKEGESYGRERYKQRAYRSGGPDPDLYGISENWESDVGRPHTRRTDSTTEVTSAKSGQKYRFTEIREYEYTQEQKNIEAQGKADGVQVFFTLERGAIKFSRDEVGTFVRFSGAYLGDGNIILAPDGRSYFHELFHHYEAVYPEESNAFSAVVQSKVKFGDAKVMIWMNQIVTEDNLQSEIAARCYNSLRQDSFVEDWDGFFDDMQEIHVAFEVLQQAIRNK